MHLPDFEDLDFEFFLKPSNTQEFSHYLLEFHGVASVWSNGDGETTEVGRIDGHRLDLAGAKAGGVAFRHFLNSVTREIAEFGQVMFGSDYCTLSAVGMEGLDETECDCLVYVDTIQVIPEFRGRHIGTFLLQRLSEVIDMENGLIALKAYPISDDTTQVNDATRIEQVKHFYERLGFRHVGHEYMIKDARTCVTARRRRAAHHQEAS